MTAADPGARFARVLAVLAVVATATSCSRPAAPPPAASAPSAALPTPTPVERGKYLVSILGCHDCHSPKVFTEQGPVPDQSRLLSGHPADVPVPPLPAGVPDPNGWIALTIGNFTAWAGPWGMSFASNLTPDPSGLGSWTEENFVQTIRTGKHLGVGRPLLPPMPWPGFAHMTDDDLKAVFAYLRTLPPIANTVPQPQPPVAAGSEPGT
jgi:hypothetical protein